VSPPRRVPRRSHRPFGSPSSRPPPLPNDAHAAAWSDLTAQVEGWCRAPEMRALNAVWDAVDRRLDQHSVPESDAVGLLLLRDLVVSLHTLDAVAGRRYAAVVARGIASMLEPADNLSAARRAALGAAVEQLERLAAPAHEGSPQ
jgi:hypothetical protein